MKTLSLKTFAISAVTLLSSVTMLNAQDSFTIKMSIKTEGLPAEMAAYGEQDMVTYIKGANTKTEISSMMFSNTSYSDGKTTTSLTDAMGNKSGFTASKEELDAAAASEPTEKPKITYTEEKKTLAGYECKKALVTSKSKDGKETVTTVWYTDKIKNPNKGMNRGARRGGMTDLSDLNGFPMAFEMPANFQGTDAVVKMTVTEVATTSIDDSVFKVNTDGYTMMTYKEMKQKMMQQGGR